MDISKGAGGAPLGRTPFGEGEQQELVFIPDPANADCAALEVSRPKIQRSFTATVTVVGVGNPWGEKLPLPFFGPNPEHLRSTQTLMQSMCWRCGAPWRLLALNMFLKAKDVEVLNHWGPWVFLARNRMRIAVADFGDRRQRNPVFLKHESYRQGRCASPLALPAVWGCPPLHALLEHLQRTDFAEWTVVGMDTWQDVFDLEATVDPKDWCPSGNDVGSPAVLRRKKHVGGEVLAPVQEVERTAREKACDNLSAANLFPREKDSLPKMLALLEKLEKNGKLQVISGRVAEDSIDDEESESSEEEEEEMEADFRDGEEGESSEEEEEEEEEVEAEEPVGAEEFPPPPLEHTGGLEKMPLVAGQWCGAPASKVKVRMAAGKGYFVIEAKQMRREGPDEVEAKKKAPWGSWINEKQWNVYVRLYDTAGSILHVSAPAAFYALKDAFGSDADVVNRLNEVLFVKYMDFRIDEDQGPQQDESKRTPFRMAMDSLKLRCSALRELVKELEDRKEEMVREGVWGRGRSSHTTRLVNVFLECRNVQVLINKLCRDGAKDALRGKAKDSEIRAMQSRVHTGAWVGIHNVHCGSLGLPGTTASQVAGSMMREVMCERTWPSLVAHEGSPLQAEISHIRKLLVEALLRGPEGNAGSYSREAYAPGGFSVRWGPPSPQKSMEWNEFVSLVLERHGPNAFDYHSLIAAAEYVLDSLEAPTVVVTSMMGGDLHQAKREPSLGSKSTYAHTAEPAAELHGRFNGYGTDAVTSKSDNHDFDGDHFILIFMSALHSIYFRFLASASSRVVGHFGRVLLRYPEKVPVMLQCVLGKIAKSLDSEELKMVVSFACQHSPLLGEIPPPLAQNRILHWAMLAVPSVVQRNKDRRVRSAIPGPVILDDGGVWEQDQYESADGTGPNTKTMESLVTFFHRHHSGGPGDSLAFIQNLQAIAIGFFSVRPLLLAGSSMSRTAERKEAEESAKQIGARAWDANRRALGTPGTDRPLPLTPEDVARLATGEADESVPHEMTEPEKILLAATGQSFGGGLFSHPGAVPPAEPGTGVTQQWKVREDFSDVVQNGPTGFPSNFPSKQLTNVMNAYRQGAADIFGLTAQTCFEGRKLRPTCAARTGADGKVVVERNGTVAKCAWPLGNQAERGPQNKEDYRTGLPHGIRFALEKGNDVVPEETKKELLEDRSLEVFLSPEGSYKDKARAAGAASDVLRRMCQKRAQDVRILAGVAPPRPCHAQVILVNNGDGAFGNGVTPQPLPHCCQCGRVYEPIREGNFGGVDEGLGLLCRPCNKVYPLARHPMVFLVNKGISSKRSLLGVPLAAEIRRVREFPADYEESPLPCHSCKKEGVKEICRGGAQRALLQVCLDCHKEDSPPPFNGELTESYRQPAVLRPEGGDYRRPAVLRPEGEEPLPRARSPLQLHISWSVSELQESGFWVGRQEIHEIEQAFAAYVLDHLQNQPKTHRIKGVKWTSAVACWHDVMKDETECFNSFHVSLEYKRAKGTSLAQAILAAQLACSSLVERSFPLIGTMDPGVAHDTEGRFAGIPVLRISCVDQNPARLSRRVAKLSERLREHNIEYRMLSPLDVPQDRKRRRISDSLEGSVQEQLESFRQVCALKFRELTTLGVEVWFSVLSSGWREEMLPIDEARSKSNLHDPDTYRFGLKRASDAALDGETTPLPGPNGGLGPAAAIVFEGCLATLGTEGGPVVEIPLPPASSRTSMKSRLAHGLRLACGADRASQITTIAAPDARDVLRGEGKATIQGPSDVLSCLQQCWSVPRKGSIFLYPFEQAALAVHVMKHVENGGSVGAATAATPARRGKGPLSIDSYLHI